MKKILISILVLLPVLLYSQGWVWKAQIQGGTYLKVVSTAVASNGTSFFMAEYSGQLTIDGNNVNSVNNTNDILIVAVNSTGTITWYKSIGSDNIEIAESIALDESNNALYVIGDFTSTCFFGATSLTSSDMTDAFLARYDLDGNLIYANKVAWGTNTQRAISICTDGSGNVVITGLYTGSGEFDGGNSLTGNAYTSNYIVKYNSSGVFQWVRGILGKHNQTWIRDIKPYSGGYIIAGQFRDTMFLDLGNIISAAANIDMFLYSIDNSGNGQWVRTVKGSAGDDHFNKIVVTDNIYIAGISKSSSLVAQTDASNSQTLSIGNSGNFDMVLFSYTTSGNYNWHYKTGSAGDDRFVYIDANGSHLSLAGFYSGTMTIGSNDLTFNAGAEGVCSAFSTTGVPENVQTGNGATSDYMRAVKYFSNGNKVVAGEFNSASLSLGTEVITNGSAGSYVMYMAKYGCFEGISVSSTPVTCVDGFGIPMSNDATATVTATGGRPPLTYNWSDGQTSQVATGLGVGTYGITVTDANGCTITSSVTTTAVPILSATISSFNNPTCIGNDGSITVTAVNGKPPYSYLWNSSPAQTTSTASGLTQGTYRVTVTDGCANMVVLNKTITQIMTFSATMSKTNATCAGTNNGTATITPVGGISPYTYKWSTTPAQTTQTATNLTSGVTYYATVTDTQGCTATGSATIATNPVVSATISSKTDVVCRSASTGSATASAVNGSPAYSYRWNTSPNQLTQTAINLAAGTYRVTITDGCGNSATATTTITQPAALAATISGTSPSCPGGNNGTAIANPTGGTPNYTYRWNTTPTQTTQTAINLSAGVNYRVTVTDNCGATVLSTVNLANPPAMTVTVAGTNPTCAGGNNGSAIANPVNGKSPYSYRWSTTPVQTLQTATGLSAGITYRVTVTDGCTNTATNTVTLTSPPAVSVSIFSFVNPSCPGSSDGSVSATPSNGLAPYSYVWSNGGTTQTISNVPAGTYRVTVTDACSKTATTSRTLTNSMTLNVTTTTTCTTTGLCTGTATATATNGISPYTYRWASTPVQTTQTAVNLCNLRYNVTVSDASGCSKVTSVRVRRCAKSAEAPFDEEFEIIGSPDISVFPNPASSIASIVPNEFLESGNIKVYNTNGVIVYKNDLIEFNSTPFKIDISNWSKGLYIVIVESDGDLIRKKFIVE